MIDLSGATVAQARRERFNLHRRVNREFLLLGRREPGVIKRQSISNQDACIELGRV